jgi:hypothetical protein
MMGISRVYLNYREQLDGVKLYLICLNPSLSPMAKQVAAAGYPVTDYKVQIKAENNSIFIG